VYWECLLKALEIEADGAKPYPSVIVPRWILSPFSGELVLHDLPQPLRTGTRTNAEMMTACEAAELYAAEHELILPESIDRIMKSWSD
jgi:hypothetical protein